MSHDTKDSKAEFKVDRLRADGTNYSTWKFEMELYLEAVGVFDVVVDPDTGIRACAGDTDKLDKWNKKDKKARALIVGKVDKQLYSLIKKADNTAKGTWDALAERFAQKGLFSKVALRRKFSTVTMRTIAEYIVLHIDRVSGLAIQLEDMGCGLDEQEITMTMLGGLPPRLEVLIVAMEALGDDALRWDVVTQRLTAENLRQEDERSAYIHSRRGGAAFAADTHRRHQLQPVEEKRTCYNCNEQGHIRIDCPHPQRSRRHEGHDARGKQRRQHRSRTHENKDRHAAKMVKPRRAISSSTRKASSSATRRHQKRELAYSNSSSGSFSSKTHSSSGYVCTLHGKRSNESGKPGL